MDNVYKSLVIKNYEDDYNKQGATAYEDNAQYIKIFEMLPGLIVVLFLILEGILIIYCLTYKTCK